MTLISDYTTARDLWLQKWGQFKRSRELINTLQLELGDADAAAMVASPEEAEDALAAQELAREALAQESANYVRLQDECNELRDPLNLAQFALQSRESELMAIESPLEKVLDELASTKTALGALSARR